MIGIIILNYLAYEETLSCIESIKRTMNGSFKIYIVDNDSPNDSYSKLKIACSNDEEVVLIKNSQNSGYSAGNNVGIKMALEDGSKYILISNSDILFHEKSIENLKEFLDNNQNVGIVGPKVLNINDEVEKKSRLFLKTGIKEKLFARSKLRSFNYQNIYTNYYGLDKSFDEIAEVYALLGCCFMMSKDMAIKITPFDENTFLYEEEVIIGIQAEETGLKTYYVPNSVVTHYHAASSKHIGAFSKIHLVNSEIYYCKRYLNASTLQIIPVYTIRLTYFLSRCLKDVSYRKNLMKFLVQTQKRLWSADGLGNEKKNKKIIF